MQKKKVPVDAPRFVKDLRSGKSRDELMLIYDLTPQLYDKLITKLKEKGVIGDEEEAAQELADTSQRIEFREPEPPPTAPVEPPPFDRDLHTASQEGVESHNQCPQCGAAVKKSDLTCRECGHVLPGEERWSKLEDQQSIFERVPARVWGLIAAIPAAIVLFLVFFYVVIPMQEQRVEKRMEEIRIERARKKAAAAKKAPSAAKKPKEQPPPEQKPIGTLEEEVETLINEGILYSARDDYETLRVGEVWSELTWEEQKEYLERVRVAMERERLYANFTVIDGRGDIIVMVTDQDIRRTETEPPE